jgi:hypothetical protein
MDKAKFEARWWPDSVPVWNYLGTSQDTIAELVAAARKIDRLGDANNMCRIVNGADK